MNCFAEKKKRKDRERKKEGMKEIERVTYDLVDNVRRLSQLKKKKKHFD